MIHFSISEAGKSYLETICPVNDAWDTVDLEIDTMRSVIIVNPDALHAHKIRLDDALQKILS